MRNIAISDVTYHIWKRASNYDERGIPGIQVTYQVRDVGHFAAIKYCRIYQQTDKEAGEMVEEDWPEDLPVLERE